MATNTKYQITSKRSLNRNEFVKGITDGDRFILAQAITLIESQQPSHRQLANEIIQDCMTSAGKSTRIGITGVPGVGKSTFIEAFGETLIGQNHKVAILAIDPSSSISKGSILGDKTRMEQLSANPNCFIRPSPSSGSLGGVAQSTRESMMLCEAAGFDTIIVETVGVGQSETEVSQMVDCFILLMLAGAGDELQGIKRGIMEMANIFIINKADGENIKKANQAKQLLKSALHLFPVPENGYLPSVLKTSSLNKEGMEDIYQELMDFTNQMKRNGSFERNRSLQNLHWFDKALEMNVANYLIQNKELNNQRTELRKKVENGKLSPFQASQILMNRLGLK